MGEPRIIGVVVALAAALVAASAPARAAEEPLKLPPSSDWVVDRDDDSCAVRRTFRTPADQALLEFRQHGPGDGFQVLITSTTLDASGKAPRVRFEPDTRFYQPDGGLFYRISKGVAILYRDSLRPNDLSAEEAESWREADWDTRERQITALSVKEGFERPIVLRTGAFDRPMAALRECMAALLERWGVDAGVQAALSRPARPLDMDDWRKRVQARYPLVGSGRRSGVSNIRLVVGADGRPTSCIPNKDTLDRSFDEHTCEVMMRHARFEPALDANGRPAASFWTTTVTYMTR